MNIFSKMEYKVPNFFWSHGLRPAVSVEMPQSFVTLHLLRGVAIALDAGVVGAVVDMVSSSPVLAVDQGVYVGRLVAVNLWKQKLHIVYRIRKEYYGDNESLILASHLSAEHVISQVFCPDWKTTFARCRAAGLVPPTLQCQGLWIRKVITPMENHLHNKI